MKFTYKYNLKSLLLQSGISLSNDKHIHLHKFTQKVNDLFPSDIVYSQIFTFNFINLSCLCIYFSF